MDMGFENQDKDVDLAWLHAMASEKASKWSLKL